MKKILIVNSYYYKDISNNLVFYAKKRLLEVKFKLSIINIPGAFEIPITISRKIKNFDAAIAVGCIIKASEFLIFILSLKIVLGLFAS